MKCQVRREHTTRIMRRYVTQPTDENYGDFADALHVERKFTKSKRYWRTH